MNANSHGLVIQPKGENGTSITTCHDDNEIQKLFEPVAANRNNLARMLNARRRGNHHFNVVSQG